MATSYAISCAFKKDPIGMKAKRGTKLGLSNNLGSMLKLARKSLQFWNKIFQIKVENKWYVVSLLKPWRMLCGSPFGNQAKHVEVKEAMWPLLLSIFKKLTSPFLSKLDNSHISKDKFLSQKP